jgi:hypothetical protein
MDDPSTRTRLAEDFLREAVYRSRGKQAVQVGLAGGNLDQPSGPANCGLGEKAAVDLDLSPKAEEFFQRLWPEGLEPPDLERIQDVMREWIPHQDSLDRKRNHFLRSFRQEHGVDHQAYTAEEQAKYDEGLKQVNEEVDDGLHKAAEELLG